MAEKRLKTAIKREKERVFTLTDQMEESKDRGEKMRLAHRRRKPLMLIECLQYALALVRGEEEEE